MIQMDSINPNDGWHEKQCICFKVNGDKVSILDNAWNCHVLFYPPNPGTTPTLTKVLGVNIITDFIFPCIDSQVAYRNVVSVTFEEGIWIMYTVDDNCVCTRMNDSHGYLKLVGQKMNLFLHPINIITVQSNLEVVGIRISWGSNLVDENPLTGLYQLPEFESSTNIFHYDNGYIFFEWNELYRIILVPRVNYDVRLPKQVIEIMLDTSTPKDYNSFFDLGYEMYTYPMDPFQ
jgi:hypothetical protein